MVADTTTYTIRVHTGDIRGAGTDANVYIWLYGEHSDSGRLELRKSETFRDPFERGHVDVFTRELLDIGNLQRVVVGHDNAGLTGGAWFLDKVSTDVTKRDVMCLSLLVAQLVAHPFPISLRSDISSLVPLLRSRSKSRAMV